MKKKLLSTCFIVLFIGVFTLITSPCSAQIKTAKMQHLNITFDNVTFKKSFIHNLTINAYNVDFDAGKVGTLSAKSSGFKNNKLFLDNLEIVFKNVLFYPGKLFSEQKFILKQPVTTQARARITQTSLNRTLNQPKLLKKLSNITKAKIKKFGIELQGGLISFERPQARILTNNTIQIEMIASVSGLLSFPVKYTAVLDVRNSKLVLTSPKLIASGVSLPQEVTGILSKKLSSLIDVDKKLKDDADISIISINMIPDKEILLKANAIINKLEFSKKDKK